MTLREVEQSPRQRFLFIAGRRRWRVKPAVEIYDTGEFTASGSRHVKLAWKGVNGDSIEWQDAIK